MAAPFLFAEKDTLSWSAESVQDADLARGLAGINWQALEMPYENLSGILNFCFSRDQITSLQLFLPSIIRILPPFSVG
jgi:hypothetical protein